MEVVHTPKKVKNHWLRERESEERRDYRRAVDKEKKMRKEWVEVLRQGGMKSSE